MLQTANGSAVTQGAADNKTTKDSDGYLYRHNLEYPNAQYTQSA